MKIVDLQSKDNRKAYQTPLLKNLGEVRELTRDLEKGSTGVDASGEGDPTKVCLGGCAV